MLLAGACGCQRGLVAAIYRDEVDRVRQLIERGADVNAPDRSGWSPLSAAAFSDCPRCAEMLVAAGADVNLQNPRTGRAPLHEAGSGRMVAFLVAHGAKTDVHDSFGDTPLHDARTGEVAEALISAEAPIEAVDNHGWAPLHVAAACGNNDVLTVLLRHHADTNARDQDGRSPLHRAAERGVKEAVKILLAAGADLQARDRKGASPLHLAAFQNRGTAEVLLAAGADVHARDGQKATPLHYSVSPVTAEMLLSAGAPVNARDEDGATPLLRASEWSLITPGGLSNLVWMSIISGLFDTSPWKVQKVNRQMVELLLSRGANPNLADRKGQTPLRVVARAGRLDLVKSLLQHHADPNLADAGGVTPLQVATAYKDRHHRAVAAYLRAHGAK